MTLRLLFVHAHPDDESIFTSGTIAHYLRSGAEVMLVTATLGEEGEVIGDQLKNLTARNADQLGGYRYWELKNALAALADPIVGNSVRLEFLGDVGFWRDSGLGPMVNKGGHRTFSRHNDPQETQLATEQLYEKIQHFRPHIVVTYDPFGAYGHPDHIQAHIITAQAVQLSLQRHQWQVPRFFQIQFDQPTVEADYRQLDRSLTWPESWTWGEYMHKFFPPPDKPATVTLNVSDLLATQQKALAAHRTQIQLPPVASADRNAAAFVLSNEEILPILSTESYRLIGGTDYGLSGILAALEEGLET